MVLQDRKLPRAGGRPTSFDCSVIMEKNGVATFSRLFFYPILFILAGNDDMHESSEEFKIWPDPTTDCSVSCP